MSIDDNKVINKEKKYCPACGKNAGTFFTEKNKCNLYFCRDCGSIFVWPVADPILEIYSEKYFFGASDGFGYVDYEGDKEILIGNFKKYLKILKRFSLNEGRLLDVGAATGSFIDLANNNGWHAAGIEISASAVECGKRNGVDISNGNFETYSFEKDSLDVITFWDVFEHFPNPNIALHQANNFLKKGGTLAINTPDARSFVARMLGKRWHLLSPPEHLNCFSREGLEMALRRNNFEVVYFGRVGKKFSLRYVFKTLTNCYGFFLWKMIYNFLKKNRIGALRIPLNTRDNMFIIARKKLE